MPLRPLALALLTFLLATAARADCPPAVANLSAVSTLCGGPIQLRFTPPPGALVFPQIFRSPFPDPFFAQQISTGTLNATSADAATPAHDAPYFFFVRWQGLDANCQVGPLVGPVAATSYDPALQSVFARLPAPDLSANCSVVIVTWPVYREIPTVSVVRTPVSGPGLIGGPLTIATISNGATLFVDNSGIPGTTYDYHLVLSVSSCGQNNVLSSSSHVVYPGFTLPPIVTSADVTAGARATLSAQFGPIIPGASTARWFRDNTLVTDIPGRISGSTTTTLTFLAATPDDAGLYTLRTSNFCGPLPEATAALIVRQRCIADANNDARLGVDDIFFFLNAWFAGCP